MKFQLFPSFFRGNRWVAQVDPARHGLCLVLRGQRRWRLGFEIWCGQGAADAPLRHVPWLNDLPGSSILWQYQWEYHGNMGIPQLYWLVVWNMNFIFPYIGNVIIPTDFHIFQRD
jgi:hypothetical protein